MSILDKLYKFDGTELDIASSEGIQLKRESDLVYSTRRGTYIPQSACYDSTRNCFYLIGNNSSTDGTARISAFSNWRHPDNEIRSATLYTGHSNSIAYNPTTDEILVACGGGNASGEAQYANDIAVVDAATLTIKRRVTYSSGDKPDGIAFCGDCICVHVLGSASRLELRSLDLSSVIKSKNAPKSVVSNYLGYAAEGCMVGQSLTYDPDTEMIYRVYSGYSTGYTPSGTEHIGEYNYGILAGYAKSDLTFKHAIVMQAYDREEIESYIFGDDNDYIVATGAYNMFRIYSKKLPTTIARTAIPSGADINTYFKIGTYFSMSAAVSGTLLNIPPLAYGFTLMVLQTGNDLRTQVIIATNGSAYYRVGKTISDWTAWKNISASDTSARFIGKRVYCTGDSIMWGRTSQSSRATVTIPDNIESRYPVSVTNAAVGGDTIAHQSNGKSVYDRITQVDLSNYDYVVINGGTNDFGVGIGLGTIDSTDESTFLGAYNKIIAYILGQNPEMRIMLITPTFRNYVSVNGSLQYGNAYNIQGNGGCTLNEICDAVIDIGKKYAVPVFDSRLNSPINLVNYASTLELTSGITDRYLHPTDDAYRLYGDSIASYFGSVF